MLKTTKHLDELQLVKRGNVYKRCLFVLVSLLLLNTILYSFGIEWAEGRWPELTIIIFVIVLCHIEFIYYEIYPLSENMQKFLAYFSGIIGIAAIIACVYEAITEKPGIIADGKIVISVLGGVYGLMLTSIFVAYMLKKRLNARHGDNEWEE